jgi:hypothetical protein
VDWENILSKAAVIIRVTAAAGNSIWVLAAALASAAGPRRLHRLVLLLRLWRRLQHLVVQAMTETHDDICSWNQCLRLQLQSGSCWPGRCESGAVKLESTGMNSLNNLKVKSVECRTVHLQSVTLHNILTLVTFLQFQVLGTYPDLSVQRFDQFGSFLCPTHHW